MRESERLTDIFDDSLLASFPYLITVFGYLITEEICRLI